MFGVITGLLIVFGICFDGLEKRQQLASPVRRYVAVKNPVNHLDGWVSRFSFDGRNQILFMIRLLFQKVNERARRSKVCFGMSFEKGENMRND